MGTGQQERVRAVEHAIQLTEAKGHDLSGTVLASDGMIPKTDSIELAGKKGITAIIQPGGSKKDKEVIAAANKHRIAMVSTGPEERCFAHH